MGYERVSELKHELQASEDHCASLRLAVDHERKKDDQASERLRSELDDARNDLQRSLKEAADAHGSEVSRYEDEVARERQRGLDEAYAEHLCAEHILQLKDTRSRMQEEHSTAMKQSQVGVGRSAMLSDEVRRVREEVWTAQQRLAAARELATL